MEVASLLLPNCDNFERYDQCCTAALRFIVASKPDFEDWAAIGVICFCPLLVP